MAEPTVPLGGVDIFHVRTDAELRARAGGRNLCALLAEVEGRVDVHALRERIRTGPEELHWQLGRSLREPWVWRPGGPGMPVVLRAYEGDLLQGALATLNDPVSGRAPWRVGVLRGPERDAVVLTWYHAAADAKGASRLMRWLGSDAPAATERYQTGDRLIAKLDAAQRRELSQAYIDHVFSLGELPITSLRRANRRRPGPPKAHRIRLSAEQTAAFDGSVRKRAGLADTSLLMFAAARLFDDLLAARGFSPPQHLVPVPLSLDPKKASGRLFGNHLTMMMLTLDRAALSDEARAVTSLAKQRREIVRHKLDAGMIAAMRSTAWVPWPLVDWLSRRPFGGERSSFVLSNPGLIDLPRFQGLAVRDAFTLPMVLCSPGLQITADRQGERLAVSILYREGLLELHELERAEPRFIADLLGTTR